jgi:putative ABC transport system permease protein
LGLRIALGASAGDLLRLVFSQGLVLITAGVVVGMTAALGLTRLMGNLLYKVSPRDPVAFGLAFLVITISSFSAVLIPALRAAGTDPARALRE